MEDINKVEICEAKIGKSGNSYSKYYNETFCVNGAPKGYELEKFFTNPQEYIENIVGLSRYYYNKSGIIMRVINIIRDFGASDYEIKYPTRHLKAKKVTEALNKRLNLKQLLQDMLFEIALTGSLACYNRDFDRVDIYPVTAIDVVPVISNGNPVIAFKPDFSYVSDGYEYGEEVNKALETAYPPEVTTGIKKGDAKIILNPRYAYFKKINSSSYEKYGIPFILPAFDDLAHKNLMKEAERSTALGIIEKILRVSVGNDEHKPTSAMIEKYDQTFNGIKGSARITVPYYVNLGWVEPMSDVFGQEKFEQVDNDLLSTLGVSLTLIKGEGGGNYAEGTINFTGLVRTIDYIRSGIPEIINDIYKKKFIDEGIPLEHCPTMEWGEVSINKDAKVELAKWLFQNAGLPYEVLYSETGHDFDVLKVIRLEENKDKMEETFSLHAQPFQGSGQVGAPEKSMEERKSPVTQSNNEQPRTK